jgi:hypothetical protein
MAIDTRQKRFSMLNFSWVPGVSLFEADGAVDADDRLHLLHLYSGISLGLPAENAASYANGTTYMAVERLLKTTIGDERYLR